MLLCSISFCHEVKVLKFFQKKTPIDIANKDVVCLSEKNVT